MCALPNMDVFCSSLISCFPGTLFRYFLNDFEMLPVAPIITGITFVFTFHMRCIFIVMFLYFRIFLASYFTTFLFPEIATSINIHVPFSLSRVVMSGLLLWMVLSVCLSVCLHLLITQNGYIAFWLIYTDSGTCSCQCCLSNFTAISLHIVKCSWAYTRSCLFMYSLDSLSQLFIDRREYKHVHHNHTVICW